MNVSKIGATKITKINNNIYGAYRDFVLTDCVEIRERVLKNGTKILAGYSKDSKLANLVQQINKEGVVEQEKFYSSDTYGVKNKRKETQLEKITYNKIGDKLKHFQLFKTFDNGIIIEKFVAFMDIFKGIDKSERIKYNEKTYIKKDRINTAEFAKTTYKEGVKVSSAIEAGVDSDGLWKY